MTHKARLIRVVTADESFEFATEDVVIRHLQEGASVTPSVLKENNLGFSRLFFPWSEIRQIKEYDG